MAENTIKTSATSALAVGESLTAASGAAISTPAQPVAESLDDFLDRTAGIDPAQAQSPSGDENQAHDQTGDDDDAQAADDSQEQDKGGETEKAKEDADTGKPADADTTATAQSTEIGQFERGVLDKLKEAKIPEALQKRIAKSFEKEIKNRKLIGERDAILQTKDGEIETLKGQLSEAATTGTMAPSGPLAQFDTPEKLQEATARAANFIQWAKNPVGMERTYFDDPLDQPNAQTAEQKMEADHEWSLYILSHAATQQQTLAQKREAREALKKAHPELFDSTKEESKRLSKLYATDPRTQPDFDQIISDAERGRKMREEETSGVYKYHRINLNDARANGALGGSKTNGSNGKNGAHANGSNGHDTGRNGSPATQLPVPRQTSLPVPLRSQSRNPREVLREKAMNGGHSIDDYLDANA